MPQVIKKQPEPAPAEYDNSHWTRAQVRYAPADGRRAITTEGLTYGPWAVVRDERNGKYDLTHVRANIPAAINLDTEVDACRIADWLTKSMPLVFRLSTVEEMRAKLRENVRAALRQWIRSCENEGGWVQPPKL